MTQPLSVGGKKVNETKLMVSHLDYPTDATTAWSRSPEARRTALALTRGGVPAIAVQRLPRPSAR